MKNQYGDCAFFSNNGSFFLKKEHGYEADLRPTRKIVAKLFKNLNILLHLLRNHLSMLRKATSVLSGINKLVDSGFRGKRDMEKLRSFFFLLDYR